MTGVYLASAIDQSDPETLGRTRSTLESMTRFLSDLDWVSWVFNPSAAFSVGRGPMNSGIFDVNEQGLRSAGMLLAYLPEGAASIGVPMEIERARAAGKLVVVITRTKSWMLRTEGIRVFPTWDAAKGHLRSLSEEHFRSPSQVLEVMPVALDSGAQMPTRGHSDDAGLDLYVSEARTVEPGGFVDVPCGVRAQLPAWSWGLITGRSSTMRRRGLLVTQGVIDAGYRGELFAGVTNMTDEPVEVQPGERLAQLILLPNETAKVQPTRVQDLDEGSRGVNGFGSTGL